MKTIAASFVPLIALVVLGLPATAQNPAGPSDLAPAAEFNPQKDDALFTEPPPLPPADQQPPAPLGSGKAAPKRKTTKPGKESIPVDEINRRILMRKAKTKALSDPKLQELLAEADVAQTDPEKRALMRGYYELLYKRMKEANPDLASSIEQQRAASLAKLDSPRLRDLGLDALPQTNTRR